MADQGPSIADIQRARNQKQGLEAGLRQNADNVAAELQAAHAEAERLKDSLGGQERVQQTQAFPHGTAAPAPQGDSMTDKIQHAQADLYSNISEKASNLGESIKNNIASADQATTTNMRDATAAAATRLNEAGSSAADTAAGVADKAADMYNRAKETVKGALGMSGEGGPATGDSARGYEGAVFGSDDPEYKNAGAAETGEAAVTGGAGDVSGGVDHGHKVAVEIDNQLEVIDQGLESAQPATEQIMGKLGRTAAATAEEPAGADAPVTDIDDGVFTPESIVTMVSAAGQPLVPTPLEPTLWNKKSRTPNLTADEAQSFTAAGRSGGQPTIATPKEPSSLGEGSVGVSAGDPAGGDNLASAAKAAGRGLLEAVGLGGNASASLRGSAPPAGYVDDDPRTAGVAVGDMKGLKEALAGSTPTGTSGTGSTGSTNVESTTATAAAATDSSGASDLAPGVDSSALKNSAADAANAAKQGLSDAADRAREGVDSAVQAAKDATGVDTTSAAASSGGTGATGGSLFGGLAELVTGIATKVNLASNSEELLAGGVIPDAAAGPAAADGATAQPAPEAAAAAGSASGDSRISDAAAAAKDSVSDAAAAARDKAADVAGSVKEKAADAAEGVSSSMRVDDEGSLLQDAKEGFVGAYDTAANAAATAADKVKDTAASLTTSGQQQQQPTTDQHPGSASAANREGAGGGSGGVGGGSGSAGGSDLSSGGGGGILSSLKQGWEDVKHGGAPAPRAVSHAGETSASHEVTSNVERSKHLGDDQQKKVYDAEVYRVSPGSQQAGGASPASEAAKAGAIAGAGKASTGTVPHDKPDTYGVGADQKTRFDADKGINSGFGTGSAAPWDGRDSVKSVAQMFTATGSLDNQHSSGIGSILSAEEQHALVEAAAQAGAAVSAGRAGSSNEGGIRSWVSSMSAVWNNIGRAAAVGPTGKDVPQNFDNPTQNVMVDPVRGVSKSDSPTPGHKVQMRTADQVPTGGNVDDPHLLQHKAERLGKVISDSLTTSSEEAAQDPNNLKGKSSDNKPDGTEYWLKHEAAEASASLKAAPEQASKALHTAGEIVGGVAGHIGHAITHPFEKEQPIQEPGANQAVGGATGKAGESIYGVSVGGGEAAAAQDLQEKRMSVWASGEDPAKKRETLGDKVIGPLIGDATDPKHAKELADSYHRYKSEQESGEAPTSVSSGAAGGAPGSESLSSRPADTSGAPASAMAEYVGADKVGDKAAELAHRAGEAVEGAFRDPEGTARAAGDKARELSDKAAHKAHELTDKASGKAHELSNKASGKTAELSDQAANKAGELQDKASSKASELRDRAAGAADDVAGAAGRSADEARDAAARAGDKTGHAAGGVVSNVVEGAKALLGGLMGPFEKEGAFEESTAVVTGPPTTFEPVGTEQLTGREANAAEACRASPAGAGNTGSAGAAARGAAAPAGADFHQAAQDTKEGLKGMGQAGIDKTAHAAGTVTGKAAALKEDMKTRLQSGVDDAAHAAGLAAGHTEGAVETVLEQVNAMRENVAEKVSDVTENIAVPPAEVPSNTEDLIRMKQQQRV